MMAMKLEKVLLKKCKYVEAVGGIYSKECENAVKGISEQGGTPLVVTKKPYCFRCNLSKGYY